MRSAATIVRRALEDAIDYRMSLIEAYSHALKDPSASQALIDCLEYAKYYEKRFKKPPHQMKDLKIWESKIKKALEKSDQTPS